MKRSSQQADGPDPKLAALTLLNARAVWQPPRYRACSALVMPLGPKPAGGLFMNWRSLPSYCASAAATCPSASYSIVRLSDTRTLSTIRSTARPSATRRSVTRRWPRSSSSEMRSARYGTSYKNDWGWVAPLLPANERPNFRALEELVGLQHLTMVPAVEPRRP